MGNLKETRFFVSGTGTEYILKPAYIKSSSRNFILCKESCDSFCVTFSGILVFKSNACKHFRYILAYVTISNNYVDVEDLPFHDRIAIAEGLAILNSSYSEV